MTFHSRLPDYYGLLGVSQDASVEDIRQAFRRRAKQFHPDLNQTLEAKQAFLVLSEAYHVLRDETRRDAFDAIRDDEVIFAPVPRVQRPRSQAWAAGVAFVCLIGATVFVLANVETSVPISERESGDSVRVSLASVTPAAPAWRPMVVAADDPSEMSDRPQAETKAASAPSPAVESWQATASPGRLPLVTAPDILDDLSGAEPLRPTPVLDRAEPAPSATTQKTPVVVAAPPQVAKQVHKSLAKRVVALVPRARAVTARQVRYARAYAAAQAAKLWQAKKRQQRAVRRVTKRRYAAT